MPEVKVFNRDVVWKIKHLSLTEEEQLVLAATLTYRLSLVAASSVLYLIYSPEDVIPHSYLLSSLPCIYNYVFLVTPSECISWKDDRGAASFYEQLKIFGLEQYVLGEKYEVDYSSVIQSESKVIIR